MRTSVRRTTTLAAAVLALAAYSPPALADNLTTDPADGVVASATRVNFGDVCAGATLNRTLGFNLVRSGNGSQNVWANSATVVTGPGQSQVNTARGNVTLGGLSTTLPSNWATAGNNFEVNAGDASIKLVVPSGATLGAGSTGLISYSASGPGAVGGTTTRTTSVQVDWNIKDCAPADTTPPVVSYAVTPGTPPGSNGWYNGDVGIDWTVADAQSPVTSNGCADTTLTTDGVHVLSCTASSAGGTTGPVSVTLKRDATAPVVEPVVSGELGTDGWYTGDVTVDWAVTETGSGVDSAVDCDPSTLSEDAASRTFTCTVTDKAGNVTTRSTTVKRDATEPAIGHSVSGVVGNEGWYTSEVDVTWSIDEAGSGLVSETCAPVSLAEDTTADGETFTCDATDAAGNSASDSVNVKRDATAPQIGFTRTGLEGANGWFTGPVDLSWQVEDTTSGLGSLTGCEDVTVSADTSYAGADFGCVATDVAGNSSDGSTANIRKDGSAPELEHTVTGDQGNAGWYTSDVDVAFEYDDASSGVATVLGCAGGSVVTDTAGATFDCAVTNEAGLTSTDGVSVKRDATDPVIDKTVTGTEGNNGWFTSDVSIDWTVSDAMSEVAESAGCEDVSVSSDTAGVDHTCTVTDRAGNRTSLTQSVKRDATRPVVTPVVTGQLGDNGFYTGDVTVAWQVVEDGSGLEENAGCPEAVLAEDTKGSTFECTVSDQAGNLTTVSTEVKRDATKPIITSTVSGTEGENGWYVGDVTLDWTVSDATSDLASSTGCDDTVLDHDSSSTTFTCSAKDRAGNGDSSSVELRRDTAAPAIGLEVAGVQGSEGWYTGDVTVDWTVTDAGSGLAETGGCDDVVRSEDTSGTSYTCTASDRAGNHSERSVTIQRDASRPVVEHVVSGVQGADGWYTGDVSVDWTVTDPTSGLASTTGCADVTRTEDTTGVTYTCTATNRAGLEAGDSVTVRRDATAPAVTLVGGPSDGATYDFGDVIATPTCSAHDTTAGVSAAGCSVTGGGSAVGSYSFTGKAADNAGNQGSATVGYTVRAWTLDGFYKPVTMGSAVVNTVKAGSTVPLKFNVYKGGAPLTSNIGAAFSAKKITCNGNAIPDAIEEFSSTGQTSLRYDGTAGQWIQNWATPTAGKGSCYRVTMTTADHSSISADFLLK